MVQRIEDRGDAAVREQDVPHGAERGDAAGDFVLGFDDLHHEALVGLGAGWEGEVLAGRRYDAALHGIEAALFGAAGQLHAAEGHEGRDE